MKPTVTLNGIVYLGYYPLLQVQHGTIIIGDLPRWGEPLNAQLYVDDKAGWRPLLIDFDTNPHSVPDLHLVPTDLAQPVYALLLANVLSLIRLRKGPVQAVYSVPKNLYELHERDPVLETFLTPAIRHMVALALAL